MAEQWSRVGGETGMDDYALEARLVLRAGRVGTLATQSDGQPFAGLVTPATDPGGAVLMLLSDMSEHTRHLRDDGRCAVMVAGAPTEANPQTAPRLTVQGRAVITAEPEMRARWLAAHPYAAFYADFTDFNVWRMVPEAGHFIGGFARAFRLEAAQLAAAETVAPAAAEIMAHCNADHADVMALLAGGDDGWAMVAVDSDGCDLSNGDVSRRVAWPEPVDGANGVRAALIRLARAARL